MNYNLDFDFAAIILMGMFFFYYFSRRRFQTMQSKLFITLATSVLFSILLDILSSYTIIYSSSFSAPVIYIFAILYFVITGAMALLFCIYSLVQSGSGDILHGFTGKLCILFIPYTIFIAALFTTPFTRLIFYVDEEGNYQQGPYMISLLILVILYLVFSFFRITFFSDNFSFRKRLPYYSFMLFMTVSVILQWILKDYLLYGFAQALGTIVLYLSNHNSNDLIDMRTDLYNRKTAALKLKDIKLANKRVCLIGIAVFDHQLEKGIGENELTAAMSDSFANQITEFLRKSFGIDNCFCIENGIYMIICSVDDVKKTQAIINDRFVNPWKVRHRTFSVTPGIVELYFPADSHQINQIFDFIVDGVRNSVDKNGEVMHKEDIIDEKERRIYNLVLQREQLEKQYIETENKMNKALNADKSKSIFLAQMSHEIRTPMTAILGMTELILRHTKDPKVVEYSSSIMNSGRNLLGIINDILDFSKIESGKLSLVCDKYMMSSVVYDIVTGIEQRIFDKHLDFRVRFENSIPSHLMGDEIRVKQIMFNILTNACKYTERGSITFSIGGERSGDTYMLKIDVSDTGIGIKEENIPHLFEGFERFDLQRNKTIEGSGLGLAIVKQLLDLMNGTISVESKYGVGTTFTVCIPQPIVVDEPSVNLDNLKGKYFAIYLEKEAFREDACLSLDRLNIPYRVINNYDELCALSDDTEITDILVYAETYRQLRKNGMKLADDSRLIVSVMYGDYIDNYDKRVLHMPLCSLNFGTFLNGASLQPSFDNFTYDNYIAPDARLLVVDDNLVNLRIFSNLLEPHGFSIEAVDNGDAAIKLTSQNKYDIVFLDHMMPHKDGIETIREILSDVNNPNINTPFVAFTANAISGMKEMFLDIGFKDFLSKPIDISRLEEIIRNYIPKEKIQFGKTMDEKQASGDDNLARKLSDCGLNIDTALAGAGDNIKTLKSVLEIFCADGKKKYSLMYDYMKDKKYADFQIEIHAVKSLCKGIGVEQLSERARLLEMACKEHNESYVDDNYAAVLEDYSSLIASISNVLSGTASEDKEQGEAVKLNMTYEDMLRCLRMLVKDFEEETADHLVLDLQRIAESPEEKERAAAIKSKLDVFDYDGVCECIEEVIDQ